MHTSISIHELSQKYTELFDVSATALLRQLNPSFDELSQKQAYEFAGREWIKYHVNNGNGIYIAKILEALQHKGYITIKSYSTPQVIKEFDIQCSETAINKYLNKGTFYNNPTRPENGITTELQQIVDMLP